jgi:hypothetical protein
MRIISFPMEYKQLCSKSCKRTSNLKKCATCCINRSHTGGLGWLSYGLTGLALIRADGAQPSLHLDEYVRARTIYIWPCGSLR